MENQKIKGLTLTRVFDAPRELVFKAWTDPQLLAQWWGPHYFTNPVVEVDARPGGSIYIVMRGPDGVDYPMNGIFQEIVPPERLSFTSNALDANGLPFLENLNKVTFIDQGEKTEVRLEVVVLRATDAAAEPLKGMEAGWSQSLEMLAETLKK